MSIVEQGGLSQHFPNHIHRLNFSGSPSTPSMGENARFKNGHARVETRVLKTLGRQNGFCHPAAKVVRQKEFGKKVTKKVTEASEKVTKK